MKDRLQLCLSLIFALVLITGCAAPSGEAKVASVHVLDKSFVRDSGGQPIEMKAIARVALQGKAGMQQDVACRPTYSNQFVETGAAAKETLDAQGAKSSEITLITPAGGRLDIGKWGVCCALGTVLESKTAATVCAE